MTHFNKLVASGFVVLLSFMAIQIWINYRLDRKLHELIDAPVQPPAPISKIEPEPEAPTGELDHDVVLTFILEHEGRRIRKEVHHTYSSRGVTETTWLAWRDRQGDKAHLPIEVKDASDAVIKRFYFDYFAGYHVWEVAPVLQLIHADLATQSGSESVRILQRLIGTHADGVWGSQTAQAVVAYNATLTTPEKRREAFEKYDSMKREFFRWLGKHPDHKADLKGWLDRADDVKAYMEQYLK